MPTINDKPDEVLQSIEKHSEKIAAQEVLEDTCLSNVEEVAEDSKSNDPDMIKTVPYAISIPRSIEADESERFTPVTEMAETPLPATPKTAPKTPTERDEPAPTILEEEEKEVKVLSRPGSASPARVRSAGKVRSSGEGVAKVRAFPPANDLLNLYTAKPNPKQGKVMSFKELTAEFDRMLKPLSQQFSARSSPSANFDEYYYDTSGDCEHPVLAVEPRNPATPPTSFKIHKQRTVVKPGYTYLEPVLLDVPHSPECTEQALESLLDIAETMKPIRPRIDNYTHHPPSKHLLKPCYYCPRTVKPKRQPPPPPINHKFTRGSKCSSSSIEM